MLGHRFYFKTLRKYKSIFGTLFDAVVIERTDPNSNTVDLIKVPLKLAGKEKVLARLRDDPNIDKKTAITLPVMSFELTGMSYDEDRKLISTNRTAQKIVDDPNHMYAQYTPVPYNFFFSLYIYVKFAEDAAKIVETILPFFKPDYTVTANMIEELDLEVRDVPIIMLGQPQIQDIYEETFVERQVQMWTLNFVLKGHIWGPVEKKPIIKFVDVSQWILDNNE